MKGYSRSDGRVGIRNVVLVVYLVECAHHVARAIVEKSVDENGPVELVGFPGCYPNDYAFLMMERLLTHPNVGGILLVSLGCEGFRREALEKVVAESGRPVDTLVIQHTGGTKKSIVSGQESVKTIAKSIKMAPIVEMRLEDLIVGTVCGGSDGTSGISANPAVGRCFDYLVNAGATCIFEETGELIGCEDVMADRAATPELALEIRGAIAKAERYYKAMGYGSFAPGNADGGLTTQEEKSMGAYSKSGDSKISGLIKPGDIPNQSGLYLLDVVPDGDPLFGFPNISDNAEIAEMIACGCHLILFTTGRGSVVGSAISPVIKICANPETYEMLADDMDINAGRIITGGASVDDVGEEIVTEVLAVAGGAMSLSEEMGHREFILTYKRFEPIGPACLPGR